MVRSVKVRSLMRGKVWDIIRGEVRSIVRGMMCGKVFEKYMAKCALQ